MKLVQVNDGNRVSESDLAIYEISIEPNADTWRGGFAWTVSLGDQELECGLEASRRFADRAANKYVKSLAVRP
jgi:hypothetical protein